MSKKLFISIIAGIAVLCTPAAAFAHVIVQPNQVGVAASQLFTISVPTEKDVPTVGLRLVLPSGLQEVSPTVKASWQINTKKSGENATEIDWTNGSIPVGQRDDFTFSAQVPGSPTTLQWKAYQTYADGSVVSWDQTPSGSDDATDDKGPYSTTKVINDLQPAKRDSNSQTGPYVVAGIALLVALAALVTKRK